MENVKRSVLQGKKSSRKYFISGRHEYFALHNFLALDLSGSDKNDFIIVSSTFTWGLGFNIWREGQIKFKKSLTSQVNESSG